MYINLLGVYHTLGTVKDAGDLKTNEHNKSVSASTKLSFRDYKDW